MFPRIHISLERWRKNKEFGVWVSNQGRVRLIKNKKYLEPRLNEKGYFYVFTDKGAQAVHRLVAYTWLGDKREATYTVDHINSNKRDNSVSNLRWLAEETNQDYAQYAMVSNKVIEKADKPQKSEPELSDELKLATLYNNRLDEKTRGRNALDLYRRHRIDIRADSFEFKDWEDFQKKKNKLAGNIEDEKFLGRIMKVANHHKAYCNHFWYVKELKENVE